MIVIVLSQSYACDCHVIVLSCWVDILHPIKFGTTSEKVMFMQDYSHREVGLELERGRQIGGAQVKRCGRRLGRSAIKAMLFSTEWEQCAHRNRGFPGERERCA